jgi:hypothetical protein
LPDTSPDPTRFPNGGILPNDYVFSQSSLQDFFDCRRRFQYRYLQKLIWPALQAEPALENERHIQRGDRFHRMAQQFLIGIPEQRLLAMAQADPDPHLVAWWANFLDSIPIALSGTRFVELNLRARLGTPPLESIGLVAIYDLILIEEDGRVTIYDWKTSTHRPTRRWLLERLQTRVYPYLLAKAGAALNGGKAIAPEQITMVYWFADPQHTPERIEYSKKQFQADERFLQGMIHTIHDLPQNEFALAASESGCRYCTYRSLCGRGIQAGRIDPEAMAGLETEQDDLDFRLEEIGEIAF